MYFYIFIYTFGSAELTISMDRGLHGICIDNNANIAALLVVFK
jgi:hypothetical protein